MADPRPRRRWFVFSLRAMLLLILAVAVWLGWWVNGARNQQAALAAIRAYDVSVNISCANEFFDITNGIGGGTGFKKETKPWWLPTVLESQLGRDYFHNVDSVAFGEGSPAPGVTRRGDIVGEVARLGGLTQAALYFEVGDDDVARLSGMRSLKFLNLGKDSPRLTDASLETISRISSLETLQIHDAPITDSGLAHLSRMSRLKSLTLGEASAFSTGGSRVAVTGTGFAHLAGLPDLFELEIHSPSLTGDGLKQLGMLKQLKSLKLKGGSFRDDDLRFLASLTNLETLEIVGSTIDGTGFRHLSGLTNVTYVCLEGPNVTDAAIPFLARLPALESVMIYGTQVTASGLEGFRAASRLTQMGLIPGVTGDTKRLKRVLPGCGIINGGTVL
jgi:hypothetical protein